MKVKFAVKDMDALGDAYYSMTGHVIIDSTWDARNIGSPECYVMQQLWKKMYKKAKKTKRK